MPVPVQAIYRDIDPDVPAVYTLPAGSDFEFASSRVRLSGAGASGAFIPVLDVLTQDDRILASARPDQVFAVGDTGAVSFAPF
jgi:hypothetical protein